MDIKIEENFYKDIINAVPYPIFVKDRGHKWILLNKAFCEFMGYKLDDLLGKSDYDFFPKKEADIFWEKDEEVFRNKKENINEENFTDANGKTHIILTKKNIYINDNGQEILVGIISDITEKKIAEQNLLERNTELEKINSVMINRELKMQELKKRILELEKKYENSK